MFVGKKWSDLGGENVQSKKSGTNHRRQARIKYTTYLTSILLLLYRSELSINTVFLSVKAIDRNRDKKHLPRSVILLMLKIYPKRVKFCDKALEITVQGQLFRHSGKSTNFVIYFVLVEG